MSGSKTARDVMSSGCTCISHDSTLVDAARIMAEEGVGALPICGPEDKLIGMLTDRDIVVRCVAKGRSPEQCTAGELAQGRVIWCSEDAPVQDVLDSMEEHLVRRIPVVDSDKQLVGIIAQADIATKLGASDTAELVETVSSAPPRQTAAF